MNVVEDKEKVVDNSYNNIDYGMLKVDNHNDNGEQLIDPLIKPIFDNNRDDPVIVNDDLSQPVASITKRCLGIFYALLSAFLFTCSTFITKQLKIDLFDALIFRFLLQTVILIIYMKVIKKYSFFTKTKKDEILLQLINCFFSTTGFLAFFLAYRYLPLPDLTTIRYTQVIWTVIISAIIYREKPSIPILVAILLTTIGVSFVAQPGFLFKSKIQAQLNATHINSASISDGNQRILGFIIAFYCSIAISVNVIINKHLLSVYKTKHSLLMLQFTFLSLCVLIINQFYKYYPVIEDKDILVSTLKNDFLNWRYFIASIIGLLQIISSILTQKSIKREHPSVFTVVQSSDILFSILLQNLFTSNKSNLMSLFGSILVLISILIVGGFKFFRAK